MGLSCFLSDLAMSLRLEGFVKKKYHNTKKIYLSFKTFVMSRDHQCSFFQSHYVFGDTVLLVVWLLVPSSSCKGH